MFQSFWKIWSDEYLHHLQQRNKWNVKRPNLNIGDLVAIKEENLPPLRWKIGRIKLTHPGKDNLVRVVTVQTASGDLQRPISKIVPLIDVKDLENS